MYPRNAASPERIAIGPVILIADGTPQSSGVTITVRGQGGAEGAGGGTTAYGATGVIVYYTPTQAETDFTSFTVIASKAGCIPVCVTIVTSASATPGYAGVDWAFVANKTTANALTGTTIATTQKVDVETIKTNPVVNGGTITFPTNKTLADATALAAVAAQLPVALTGAGNLKVDVLAINGVATTPVTTIKAVQGLTTADTIATYTGNTPQTGDTFARIGATGSGLTSLAPSATALSTVQWTNGRAVALDNLDALVSSRMATFVYTAPDNAGISSAASSAASAASSAASADTKASAIQTQTNKLVFTVPGYLDVGVYYMNGAVVIGNGTSGNLWRGS